MQRVSVTSLLLSSIGYIGTAVLVPLLMALAFKALKKLNLGQYRVLAIRGKYQAEPEDVGPVETSPF